MKNEVKYVNSINEFTQQELVDYYYQVVYEVIEDRYEESDYTKTVNLCFLQQRLIDILIDIRKTLDSVIFNDNETLMELLNLFTDVKTIITSITYDIKYNDYETDYLNQIRRLNNKTYIIQKGGE